MSTTPPGREPPVILLLLWTLLWLAMWFWAIVGPLLVLAGALSFFIDLESIGISISLDGPVRTTRQKITSMALGAIMGTVGIGFLWLRRCGYLRYGPDRPTTTRRPEDGGGPGSEV